MANWTGMRGMGTTGMSRLPRQRPSPGLTAARPVVGVRLFPVQSAKYAIDQAEAVGEIQIELLHTENSGNGPARYYCRVTAKAVMTQGRPAAVSGLAVFRQPPAGIRQVVGYITGSPPEEDPSSRLVHLPLFILDHFDNQLEFSREGKALFLLPIR